MTPADATCWTLIGAAAGGDAAARERFARVYLPVARGALGGRWKGSPRLAWVEDAVQDVFVECFKPGGVLVKVNDCPPDGFRPFFHGVLRNVARRFEDRPHRGRLQQIPEDQPAEDTSLGQAFDKAWARSLLQEAALVQAELATGNERATRRVELLRLRFQEGLPTRDIAVRWNDDAVKLHHEYATARDEFRTALQRVMAFHMPTATGEQVDAACRELLNSLG